MSSSEGSKKKKKEKSKCKGSEKKDQNRGAGSTGKGKKVHRSGVEKRHFRGKCVEKRVEAQIGVKKSEGKKIEQFFCSHS